MSIRYPPCHQRHKNPQGLCFNPSGLLKALWSDAEPEPIKPTQKSVLLPSISPHVSPFHMSVHCTVSLLVSRCPAQRWKRSAGMWRQQQVRVRWVPVPGGPPLLQHMEEDEDDDRNEEKDIEAQGHAVQVSIALSTEEKESRAARVCQLYPVVLHHPPVSFLLSSLLVLTLMLWWLVFI